MDYRKYMKRIELKIGEIRATDTHWSQIGSDNVGVK
jgi:hypothetical protein